MQANPTETNEYITHERFNPEHLDLKESPNIENIPANAAWVSTGFMVAEDDIVIIDADDDTKWTANRQMPSMYDANGSGNPSQPGYLLYPGIEGALIGKIGQFIFQVGLFVHVHVPKGVSGELLLSINDDTNTLKGNEFADNAGSIDVTITVYRLAP